MEVIDRLAPPSVARAMRRMSVNQESLDEQLQEERHPPPNEYFQQVYRAQHPEEERCHEKESRTVMDRLAPSSIAHTVRRISVSSTELVDHFRPHQHPPPNEYFEQVYRAQHPEPQSQSKPSESSPVGNALGFMGGIKDSLSPASAAIGTAIRRLSTSQSDVKTTISKDQSDYLQQLHAATVAKQNRREKQGEPYNEEEEDARTDQLDLLSEIKGRFGSAVRRLSTYAEDTSGQNVSARDAFKFFQQSEEQSATSASPNSRRRAAVFSGESSKKKKKTWRQLLQITKSQKLKHEEQV